MTTTTTREPYVYLQLSNGDVSRVPNDGRDYRSYWGRASECSACYVGKLHPRCTA